MSIQTLSNGTTIRDTQSSGSSRVRDIGNIAVDTTVVGADGENIFVAESSGGAFEVSLDDRKIFSKLDLDRFPAYQEIPTLINA